MSLGCVIELGTWLGKSATFFAGLCPNAIVFAVDLWDNDYLKTDLHYIQSGENLAILNNHPIYDQFLVNAWDKRCKGLDTLDEPVNGIVPMKMDSCVAMQLLHDHNILPDIIYVDACHHYEGAYRDINTAVTLFPQAHIIGDDWDYEGVRTAAQTIARERGFGICAHSNKCWTFSKSIAQKGLKRKAEQERAETEARKKEEEYANGLKSMSFSQLLGSFKKTKK